MLKAAPKLKACNTCGSKDHATLVCVKKRRRQNSQRFEHITREEETHLGRRWRDFRDLQALSKLVAAFYPGLILFLANKFQHLFSSEDLIQEGALGLLRAAHKFDPERGVRFYTYAVYWVRAYLLDYMMRMGHVVRFGTSRKDRNILFGLTSAQHRLAAKNEEPTREALATELGVTEEELEIVQNRIFRGDISLNYPMGDLSPGDAFPSQDETPEEKLGDEEARKAQKDMIRRALPRLHKREQEIIHARFLRKKPATLLELANTYDLSRERVRQLQEQALKRLRVFLRKEYASLDG